MANTVVNQGPAIDANAFLLQSDGVGVSNNRRNGTRLQPEKVTETPFSDSQAQETNDPRNHLTNSRPAAASRR